MTRPGICALHFLRSSLPLLLFSITLVGCNNRSEIEVAGTITIDHQPLANAEIQFIPADGSTNGGSARTNHNGQYRLSNNQGTMGLAAGEYKVVISKRLRPDRSDADPAAPRTDANSAESLPSIWSDDKQTTLTATITKEKRSYDFKLFTPSDPKTYKRPK
jgi:hypothetical protein